MLASVIVFNGLVASQVHLGTELFITTLAGLYLLRNRLPGPYLWEFTPVVLLVFSVLVTVLNYQDMLTLNASGILHDTYGLLVFLILRVVKMERMAISMLILLIATRIAVLHANLVNPAYNDVVAAYMDRQISQDSIYFISTPGCGSCAQLKEFYTEFATEHPGGCRPAVNIVFLKRSSGPEVCEYFSEEGYRVAVVPDSIYFSTVAPVALSRSSSGKLDSYSGYLKGWNSLYYRYITWRTTL